MSEETTEKPDYSLFPNGSSFMDWYERNCDRCVKCLKPDQLQKNGNNPQCVIETAIALASATDGTLTHGGYTAMNKADAIAKRLNWDGQTYLHHDCPEFVP